MHMLPFFRQGQSGGGLDDVDHFPTVGGILLDDPDHFFVEADTRPIHGLAGDLPDLLPAEWPEEDLHTPGSNRRWNLFGHPGGRPDQAEIGGQTVLEDVVDVGRDIGVLRVIIGAFQKHLSVFQHL